MRRWLILPVVALLAACGTRGTAPSAANPTTSAAGYMATASADPFPAPGFTLQSLEGESVALSDLRGRWVIINFWQTTCAPCVEEMPVFQQLHDTHENLSVLAINIREAPDTIRPFLSEHRLTFPVLLSEDSVSQAYSVMALPQTLVLNPNGEIVYRQFGEVELVKFTALVNDLVATT